MVPPIKSSPAVSVAAAPGNGFPAAAAPSRTTPLAWYVAGLLSLAQIISIMDRYLLSVVLEDIKRDMVLSDTQLGIVQGPSFVVLFALASLPLGRWADVANRKWIITGAVTFWSFATAACGFADTFSQLIVARMAVGLGEAALMPAAISLILSYFSRDRLNRGLSIFTAGGSLGRAAGFSGGGAVLAYAAGGGAMTAGLIGIGFAPWQIVFLTGGVLGLAVALLLGLTLREPARRTAPSTGPGFQLAFRHFWSRRTAYLAVFVPFAMLNALTYMLAAWSISFYVREYGMSAAAAGAMLGATGLICGPAGHLAGGWLNDKLTVGGVRGAEPLLLGIILLIAPLFIIGFTLGGSVPVAAALYGLSYFTVSLSGPTSHAGVQAPTPDFHRGVISAMFLIFYMLMGAGLGPLALGLTGDIFFKDAGSLRPAIIATSIFFTLVGLPFAIFGRKAFTRASEANQALANR